MILLCDYYVIIMLLLCFHYIFIQTIYKVYYVRKQTTQYPHNTLTVLPLYPHVITVSAKFGGSKNIQQYGNNYPWTHCPWDSRRVRTKGHHQPQTLPCPTAEYTRHTSRPTGSDWQDHPRPKAFLPSWQLHPLHGLSIPQSTTKHIVHQPD